MAEFDRRNSKWQCRHGMRRKIGVIVDSPYLAAPAGDDSEHAARTSRSLSIVSRKLVKNV